MIIQTLRQQGYIAYLAGGCVRDKLLGVEAKDFDVATDAHPEEDRSLFANGRLIGRPLAAVCGMCCWVYIPRISMAPGFGSPSAPIDLPAHGVTTVFVELPNSKIELLYPLGADSPIQPFLDRNPSGGIHHICYEVDDIYATRDHLKAQGARVLGDGEPTWFNRPIMLA